VATTEGNPFLTMHRFRPFTLLAALSGAAALGVTLPSLVQAQVPAAQVRALNLARNTAVTKNGGLGVYRPQPCMFETSSGGGSCLISNNADGFTSASWAASQAGRKTKALPRPRRKFWSPRMGPPSNR